MRLINWTDFSVMVACFWNDTTGPFETDYNWLLKWYTLKMRTFWTQFEEKRAKIAWVMAKKICFSKIQLCMTSRSCIFVVLHNFFHHKNYTGTYYTLYTIVYNWFHVKKNKKKYNFLCVMTKCDLNRKNWFWSWFFDIGVLGNRLWLPKANFWGKKQDRTGPANTIL